MATLSIPHSFIPGTPALASEVNANFQAVVSWTQGQISTDNLGLLGARSVALPSSPALAILSLAQTASQIALNVSNAGTESSVAISQSGALASGKAALLINSPNTQSNAGAAELLMTLAAGSTIPALLIQHGTDTLKLTKTQLDLFNSAIQATSSSLNLFTNAVKLNTERILIPARTTSQRNAIVSPDEGSILYDTSKKELAFRTNSSWVPASTPTGSVQMFAGSAAPQGWLLCDGTEYLKTAYPDLDSILSVGGTYPYGQTNGSGGAGTTHFKTPDCRGVFVRGVGSQTISGITYTGTLATKQNDQFQGHYHNEYWVLQDAYVFGAYDPTRGPRYSTVDPQTYGPATYPPVKEAVTDGTNGTPRIGSQTQPANIAMNYIIKT